MRTSKTTWSLVSLTATLAPGALAFMIWHELWPAIIAGALIGGAVAALRAPADGELSWAAALVWTMATAVAAVCGFLAYAAWAGVWLAIVVAAVVAGVVGAVLNILVWIARPTPVDLDSMLGGPEDIWWQLRDTRVWRRLSDWVERRAHSQRSPASDAVDSVEGRKRAHAGGA